MKLAAGLFAAFILVGALAFAALFMLRCLFFWLLDLFNHPPKRP